MFHFSSKKKELLKSEIKELMPEDQRTTLLDVCRTRWLQRIDALERVEEMIEPILSTLDKISTNYDCSYSRDARRDAQGVFWTFKSFEFACHLIIVRHVISYTLSLTYELQQTKEDVVKVYEAFDNVIAALRSCRENADHYHEKWFKEVVDFVKEKLDTKPMVFPMLVNILKFHSPSPY